MGDLLRALDTQKDSTCDVNRPVRASADRDCVIFDHLCFWTQKSLESSFLSQWRNKLLRVQFERSVASKLLSAYTSKPGLTQVRVNRLAADPIGTGKDGFRYTAAGRRQFGGPVLAPTLFLTP